MTLGGTIEETKARVSYAEAKLWFAYMNKHGGIGQSRIAYLLACLNVMTNNAHGGKAALHDFLPGIPAPKPRVIESADDLMTFLNL